MLEQLKTMDEALVHSRGPVARLGGRAVAGAAIVALGGLAVAGAGTFVYVFAKALFDGLLLFKDVAGLAFLGAIGMIAGIYGIVGFAHPMFTRFGDKRRALPLRWRGSDDAAGLSPLTGRPCVAYEIGIRSDDDVDAAAGTWLLRERRGRVGVPLVRVEVDPFAEGVTHFLRTRGIDPLGQDLVFFEAIVTAEHVALAPASVQRSKRSTPPAIRRPYASTPTRAVGLRGSPGSTAAPRRSTCPRSARPASCPPRRSDSDQCRRWGFCGVIFSVTGLPSRSTTTSISTSGSSTANAAM